MTHGLMHDPIDDDRRRSALEEAHFAAMDREYEERQRRESALDEAYAAGRDDEREESGAAQAFLETLLDIWDDGQKNDPESRCYANGALRDEFEAARKFLVEGRKPAPESQFAADAQATAETTTEADARLIAAAPELLDELQKAHRLLQLALKHMGGERQALFAAESEREGLGTEGATRNHERAVVLAKATGAKL